MVSPAYRFAMNHTPYYGVSIPLISSCNMEDDTIGVQSLSAEESESMDHTSSHGAPLSSCTMDGQTIREHSLSSKELESTSWKAVKTESPPGDISLPQLSLSKKQKKKLLKQKKWLEEKPLRKQRQKEKRKQKVAQLRSQGLETPKAVRKHLKQVVMGSSACQQRVVIDLSFENFMNDRDLKKCIKQVHRCYSLNRRADKPLRFYVTSLDGRGKSEMSKRQGYENWDVYLHSSHYESLFTKEEIVYLTSESENVVHQLDETKVYIIGGLVDHNQHKGLCHQMAVEKGIPHARLPIDEHVEMKTRKVLTIDHVFDIILRVANGKEWCKALFEVIPQRKGIILSGSSG